MKIIIKELKIEELNGLTDIHIMIQNERSNVHPLLTVNRGKELYLEVMLDERLRKRHGVVQEGEVRKLWR